MKLDIFNCILCSNLSGIIHYILCPLFLVVIIIKSSKLTYEMMELEDFYYFLLRYH